MITFPKLEQIYKRSSRKIHLDFHTPYWTKQVGQDYDPESLVYTWKAAHVNAVTVVFGLCACGNAYYETDAAPVHPGLYKDMLKPLLPIARREEIEIFVHFGPGINDRAVLEHPEWAMFTKEGKPLDTQEGRVWGWPCYNAPYTEKWFYPQLKDFVARFPKVAGIFIDMVMYPENTCYCQYCRKKAAILGLDINNRDDMDLLVESTLNEFMSTAKGIVKAANPTMLFTCNTRWFVGGARNDSLDFIELEAPITWSAYHYPVMSRYLRTLSKPSGGMTTRFPFNWGYFGGLNTISQLTFECAEIMATLGACCIGDQLHPSGRAESGIYELIGQVYEYVEKREPWTLGAKTVPYIGVLADNQRNVNLHSADPNYYSPQQKPGAFYGAGLAMLEGSRQFDMLDQHSELGEYTLLWLAENIILPVSFIPKLEAFLSQGGRLLVSGSGLWQQPEWRNWLESVSRVRYMGVCEGGTYLQPLEKVANGIPMIPHFVKGDSVIWKSLTIDSLTASNVGDAPEMVMAMFGTYENIPMTKKFSHFHPPVGDLLTEPGAVISSYGAGAIALMAAPAAEYYFRSGSSHIRQLILNLMDALIPQHRRLIALEIPSTAIELSLMQQSGRWIIHLIQYAAKRNTGPNVIDEVATRTNIAIVLRPPQTPNRVCLVPSGVQLDWSFGIDGSMRIVVPELRIHEMVSVEWDI